MSCCSGVVPAYEPVIKQAAVKLLHGDHQLEAGQVGADAAVRPDPEGQVAVRDPVEDDLAGVVELLLVPAGRAEEHEDPVTLLELRAPHGDVGQHPTAGGDVALVAEHLLHG